MVGFDYTGPPKKKNIRVGKKPTEGDTPVENNERR